MKPMVSCLMASNRPGMTVAARKSFWNQDYMESLLVDDLGLGTHGAKMDRLFRFATGDIAVIWDDDDAYATNRISRLIEPMLGDPTILCVGTSLVYYVDERIGKAWLYDNRKVMENWKSNPSLFWLAAPAYRMEAYRKYGPWEDLKCGADLKFLHKIPREHIVDLRDPTLMICRIHGENAAQKEPHPPAWEEVPISQVPKL